MLSLCLIVVGVILTATIVIDRRTPRVVSVSCLPSPSVMATPEPTVSPSPMLRRTSTGSGSLRKN